MGKVKPGFMVLLAFGMVRVAIAQEEYTPKISFKDIVESQVGVVKKVMELNKKVKDLQNALTKLQEQQEKTYARLVSLEQELKQKPKPSNSNTGKSSISVPQSYQNLIDQAKSWAK